MSRSKFYGINQDVVLPDFSDDDNTTTTTTNTKSRRVSFGTNFVKEFIVGSAVSAQCVLEYEQNFSSSDSSNAHSSHSTIESKILGQNTFSIEDNHLSNFTAGVGCEPMSMENSNKSFGPRFSRTVCFNADSPTAEMEFTGGCLTLAKSILEKKNKEMTVIIEAKTKSQKDEVISINETKYFDGTQFDMSMTHCFKSKDNRKDGKKFDDEKTRVFSEFDNEMSITRCSKIFNVRNSKIFNSNDNNESNSLDDSCKENRIPLDMIMKHLDQDSSDLENSLFNPEKSLNDVLNPFNISCGSEKLNMNESMDISRDFQCNNIIEASRIVETKKIEKVILVNNKNITETRFSGEENTSRIPDDKILSEKCENKMSPTKESPDEDECQAPEDKDKEKELAMLIDSTICESSEPVNEAEGDVILPENISEWLNQTEVEKSETISETLNGFVEREEEKDKDEPDRVENILNGSLKSTIEENMEKDKTLEDVEMMDEVCEEEVNRSKTLTQETPLNQEETKAEEKDELIKDGNHCYECDEGVLGSKEGKKSENDLENLPESMENIICSSQDDSKKDACEDGDVESTENRNEDKEMVGEAAEKENVIEMPGAYGNINNKIFREEFDEMNDGDGSRTIEQPQKKIKYSDEEDVMNLVDGKEKEKEDAEMEEDKNEISKEVVNSNAKETKENEIEENG